MSSDTNLKKEIEEDSVLLSKVNLFPSNAVTQILSY